MYIYGEAQESSPLPNKSNEETFSNLNNFYGVHKHPQYYQGVSLAWAVPKATDFRPEVPRSWQCYDL